MVAGPRVPRHSIGTAGTAILAAAAVPHLFAAVHTVAMPAAAVPMIAAAAGRCAPPPLLLQTRHSPRLMSTLCGGRGTAAAAAAQAGTRRDSRQRLPRWRWGGHSTVVVSERVVVAGVAAAGVPMMAVAVTAAGAMTAQLAGRCMPLSDLQPRIAWSMA